MELHCRLSDFGMDEDEIDALFNEIDTNADESITLMEFCRGYPIIKAKVLFNWLHRSNSLLSQQQGDLFGG
jgi:hypothetical protein